MRSQGEPTLHADLQDSGQSLSALVDSYQAGGRYVITREQARQALGVSHEALKKAVRRLVAKRRLAVPRRGFFVVVPVEYRQAGAPPPSWYIDDLMKFCNRHYYVGLLTAATLHGAGHQQPQEFQVVTDRQLRPIMAGRARIRFFRKLRMERTQTMHVKTETGTMKVTTPEATALDLLRYLKGVGHLGHVVTVLTELVETMDGERIAEAAKSEDHLPSAQRLGYLLDVHGAEVPLAVREQLLGLVSPKAKIHIGSRRRFSTAGKLVRPWNVVENVPRDVLLDARDHGRRRVSFGSGSKKQ